MKNTPKKYRVTMYQEYYPEFVVEASSKVEAAELVMEGEGELSDSSVKSQELISVSQEPIEFGQIKPSDFRKVMVIESGGRELFAYDVTTGQKIDIQTIPEGYFQNADNFDYVTFVDADDWKKEDDHE